MSVELDKIIPLGRSLQEYERMFGLTEADLRRTILGCGDGPASFNAEMTRRGHSVISCDPIYTLSAEEIRERFKRGFYPHLEQVRANQQNYVWSYHRDVDELCRTREAAMRTFLEDYPEGSAEGRYVVAELPTLPFADGQFELALCSHLLFLYSNLLSYEFHRSAILEMCRVAREVRIFPLTALSCQVSAHVMPIQQEFRRRGLRVELRKVNYQFQQNGDEMMRIHK